MARIAVVPPGRHIRVHAVLPGAKTGARGYGIEPKVQRRVAVDADRQRRREVPGQHRADGVPSVRHTCDAVPAIRSRGRELPLVGAIHDGDTRASQYRAGRGSRLCDLAREGKGRLDGPGSGDGDAARPTGLITIHGDRSRVRRGCGRRERDGDHLRAGTGDRPARPASGEPCRVGDAGDREFRGAAVGDGEFRGRVCGSGARGDVIARPGYDVPPPERR